MKNIVKNHIIGINSYLLLIKFVLNIFHKKIIIIHNFFSINNKIKTGYVKPVKT